MVQDGTSYAVESRKASCRRLSMLRKPDASIWVAGMMKMDMTFARMLSLSLEPERSFNIRRNNSKQTPTSPEHVTTIEETPKQSFHGCGKIAIPGQEMYGGVKYLADDYSYSHRCAIG